MTTRERGDFGPIAGPAPAAPAAAAPAAPAASTASAGGQPGAAEGVEHFVVSREVPEARADAVAEAAIRESIWRPADVDAAAFSTLRLAWIPLWRVDVSVEGFHIGLHTTVGREGRRGGFLPHGGFRHREEVVIVPGRRLLAVDPSGHVTLRVDELRPFEANEPREGEVVAADVGRAAAEAEAIERVRRRIQPSSALYAKFDARVRSVALVHYPVWVARYRYAGEATKGGLPEECHVAVSARTGRVVSARHPSALRAVVGKVRGFLSELVEAAKAR